MPKGEGNGLTVKARLNLKIPEDLKNWATKFAKDQGTTVTELIVNYFRFLREEEARRALADEYSRQI